MILGYAGRFCRFFDVLSNFKLQIFQAALFFIVLSCFFKKPRKLWIANLAILAIIIIITLTEILPWYLKSEYTGGNGTTFRVSLINVLKKNDRYSDVIDFVGNITPDLLVFMEIDDKWFEKLKLLDSGYQSKIVSSSLGNDGIVVYSKFPILKSEEIYLSPKGRPNLKITLNIAGKIVDFFIAHPVSPTRKPGKWEDRNTHIENLGKVANFAKNPVIVIADMNTSMWSPFYKKMISNTNLRNTRKGFGICGTYPAPTALISGIPIDHILIDNSFSCQEFSRGPYIGSDHLPIYANLTLNKNN
jgi:endonuclease/exonuclease/phosphatase (EEP) superfamily protein YafD